jgi:hypothetical protein
MNKDVENSFILAKLILKWLEHSPKDKVTVARPIAFRLWLKTVKLSVTSFNNAILTLRSLRILETRGYNEITLSRSMLKENEKHFPDQSKKADTFLSDVPKWVFEE